MHGYTILNGDDLDENGNSKEVNLVMHGQKKCVKAILTKIASLKGKPLMHGYITSHAGNLNENDKFKIWELIIHGYKICMGAILTKMKS